MSDNPNAPKPVAPPVVQQPMQQGVTPPIEPAPHGIAAGEPNGTDRIVDEWARQHLADSVVSRDTEAWNHIQGALPDLKERLRGGR